MLYSGSSVKPQKCLIGVSFRGLRADRGKFQIPDPKSQTNFKPDLKPKTRDVREARAKQTLKYLWKRVLSSISHKRPDEGSDRSRSKRVVTAYSVHGLQAIDVVHSLVPPHLVFKNGDCGRILFQDLLLNFHDCWVLLNLASVRVVPGQKAVGWFPDNLIPWSRNDFWGMGIFLVAGVAEVI